MERADVAAILSAVAWPAVAGGALYLYKRPIIDFLPRVARAKIGATGAEFETLPPNQQDLEGQAESSAGDAAKKVGEGLGGFPAPMEPLSTYEKGAIEFVKREHPHDENAQIAWMGRLYSIALLEKFHEQNFRLIFGSQLLALYRINASGGTAALSLLKPIYEQAVADWPDVHNGRSMDDWLSFLLHVQLATRSTGADADDRISITPKGVFFLKYIIDNKLPEKPF